MRYSVYNHTAKVYDYYEGSGPKGTHAGTPPKALGKSSLGATAEQASWKLPPDARKVGSGELAQGRIAVGGMGALGEYLPTGGAQIAVFGVAAYLLWRHFR